MTGLINIKKAISNLNPDQVRQLSQQQLTVGIRAWSPEAYGHVEEFLLAGLSPDRRRQSSLLLRRDDGSGGHHVLFDASNPHISLGLVVAGVLNGYPDFSLALARVFPPFRRAFVDQVIARTCKENTLFSLTTALPDVIPNIIELPWAVAEFASDTAFLTMNQLRMAFLIAAASDREVGYREQKSEIATVIAGAFGWRAIARQLIGKIPFGGGLIGKAAVAYAGTKVVGISLDHLYSVGYNYTRQERETLYAEALRKGREVAAEILRHIRPDIAAKIAVKANSKVPMVYPRGDTP